MLQEKCGEVNALDRMPVVRVIGAIYELTGVARTEDTIAFGCRHNERAVFADGAVLCDCCAYP